MTENLLPHLYCPVQRQPLQLTVYKKGTKQYDGQMVPIIEEGLLSCGVLFYPIIKGVPRLTVEACREYSTFLKANMPDYTERLAAAEAKYGGLLDYVSKKNKPTKDSFSQEWGLFNYETDKVWDADDEGMLERFLKENDETKDSLKGKFILDAGCGNGRLNQSIAACGATIMGMDFSNSIERAFEKNDKSKAWFVQGDVQFPPFPFEHFDTVHSSGVLICTTNSELTFSCLETSLKKNGKMSVWLYHPVKGFIHNAFNWLRNRTSKLPIRFQYYLYLFTLFPISYVVKRLKGNKQNTREMMIDILDWFSPQYRWEHDHDEAAGWFYKRGFTDVKVTTNELFGFNIIGTRTR